MFLNYAPHSIIAKLDSATVRFPQPLIFGSNKPNTRIVPYYYHPLSPIFCAELLGNSMDNPVLFADQFSRTNGFPRVLIGRNPMDVFQEVSLKSTFSCTNI